MIGTLGDTERPLPLQLPSSQQPSPPLTPTKSPVGNFSVLALPGPRTATTKHVGPHLRFNVVDRPIRRPSAFTSLVFPIALISLL